MRIAVVGTGYSRPADDTVITEIGHDSQQPIFITGVLEPGFVRRRINYGNMSSETLDVFMDGFEHCEQVSGRDYGKIMYT